MTIDAAEATFRKVGSDPATGAQIWDFVAGDGTVFARAEVFSGNEQWGVRLQDRAPDLETRELVSLVGRLLVWEIGCKAETVDVVLGRTHEHQTLVRVAGEYV